METVKKLKSRKDAAKSVRKTWEFDPVSRVVESKKKYNRKPKHKKEHESHED